ncbi:hypothetical protein HanIR_Chr12g0565601 [Helianthus annuus]|nr:hypothetical protein HanIR_Chr12g0565601 [Helianthus annuus]
MICLHLQPICSSNNWCQPILLHQKTIKQKTTIIMLQQLIKDIPNEVAHWSSSFHQTRTP